MPTPPPFLISGYATAYIIIHDYHTTITGTTYGLYPKLYTTTTLPPTQVQTWLITFDLTAVEVNLPQMRSVRVTKSNASQAFQANFIGLKCLVGCF